jgi:4-hydroxy-tetrahydrodipicolinate reductase
MKTLRIALLGYGKMGKAAEKAALKRGHTIQFTIDSENDWVKNSADLNQADIAIDFSMPDKAKSNILKCFEANIPVVTGTTGWYNHLPEILSICTEKRQSFFYAPNFSLGMNMVFKMNAVLARMSAKTSYEISLTETHHIHKKDAPSGTALQLARDIIKHNERYDDWAFCGENNKNQLGISCHRINEVPGTHEIRLDSDEDTITFRHVAKSRDGFALGAVLAAEYLYGKIGVFTMENIIEQLLND